MRTAQMFCIATVAYDEFAGRRSGRFCLLTILLIQFSGERALNGNV